MRRPSLSSFWRTRASICVADGNDVGGIGVLADGELAGRDDTFGLVADVEQDFVALDLDDGTADEVALVEVGHRTVDESMHLLVGVLALLDDRAVLILLAHFVDPFSFIGAPVMSRRLQLRQSRVQDISSPIGTCTCLRGPTLS